MDIYIKTPSFCKIQVSIIYKFIKLKAWNIDFTIDNTRKLPYKYVKDAHINT